MDLSQLKKGIQTKEITLPNMGRPICKLHTNRRNILGKIMDDSLVCSQNYKDKKREVIFKVKGSKIQVDYTQTLRLNTKRQQKALNHEKCYIWAKKDVICQSKSFIKKGSTPTEVNSILKSMPKGFIQ